MSMFSKYILFFILAATLGSDGHALILDDGRSSKKSLEASTGGSSSQSSSRVKPSKKKIASAGSCDSFKNRVPREYFKYMTKEAGEDFLTNVGESAIKDIDQSGISDASGIVPAKRRTQIGLNSVVKVCREEFLDISIKSYPDQKITAMEAEAQDGPIVVDFNPYLEAFIRDDNPVKKQIKNNLKDFVANSNATMDEDNKIVFQKGGVDGLLSCLEAFGFWKRDPDNHGKYSIDGKFVDALPSEFFSDIAFDDMLDVTETSGLVYISGNHDGYKPLNPAEHVSSGSNCFFYENIDDVDRNLLSLEDEAYANLEGNCQPNDLMSVVETIRNVRQNEYKDSDKLVEFMADVLIPLRNELVEDGIKKFLQAAKKKDADVKQLAKDYNLDFLMSVLIGNSEEGGVIDDLVSQLDALMIEYERIGNVDGLTATERAEKRGKVLKDYSKIHSKLRTYYRSPWFSEAIVNKLEDVGETGSSQLVMEVLNLDSYSKFPSKFKTKAAVVADVNRRNAEYARKIPEINQQYLTRIGDITGLSVGYARMKASAEQAIQSNNKFYQEWLEVEVNHVRKRCDPNYQRGMFQFMSSPSKCQRMLQYLDEESNMMRNRVEAANAPLRRIAQEQGLKASEYAQLEAEGRRHIASLMGALDNEDDGEEREIVIDDYIMDFRSTPQSVTSLDQEQNGYNTTMNSHQAAYQQQMAGSYPPGMNPMVSGSTMVPGQPQMYGPPQMYPQPMGMTAGMYPGGFQASMSFNPMMWMMGNNPYSMPMQQPQYPIPGQYPPTGYPPTGYPPTGYPPTGYPQQGQQPPPTNGGYAF